MLVGYQGSFEMSGLWRSYSDDKGEPVWYGDSDVDILSVFCVDVLRACVV